MQEGISITLGSDNITLHGSVLVLLADTLAAHDLGGFKVGVGFALRKCRMCLATDSDIQSKVNLSLANSNIIFCPYTQFTEEEFLMRTPDNHDYHCSLLQGPLAAHDSTTYGVNSESVLNEFDDFHVANGQLPQDIMHVLYEGVLPLNIRLMLGKFVLTDKLFTLQQLNDRISSFPWGRSEVKNKPTKTIELVHLHGTSKLPFSGT